jgi:hypothetical protein
MMCGDVLADVPVAERRCTLLAPVLVEPQAAEMKHYGAEVWRLDRQ